MEGRVSEEILDKAVMTFGMAMTNESSERNALAAVRAQWEAELEPAITADEAQNLVNAFMGGVVDADLLNSVTPKLEAIIGHSLA